MVNIVTNRIINIAINKARKQANGQGWVCGTYASNVGKLLKSRVRRSFTDEEFRFVIDHLAEFNEEEVFFALIDQDRMEICEDLNHRLNELIPALMIHRRASFLFDD